MKTFACKHCDRAFATFGALHQHHRDKHPDLPQPKRPYVPVEEESEADRHIDHMLFGRWS